MSPTSHRRLVALLASSAACLVLPLVALAHQPIVSRLAAPPSPVGDTDWRATAQEIIDPTAASSATYAFLPAGQVRIFSFTVAKDETIPIEVLVPVRPSLADFRPAAYLIGPTVNEHAAAPVTLPSGLGAVVIPAPTGNRGVFFEPFSQENYWQGEELRWPVKAGKRYWIAVNVQSNQSGSFVLGVGTAENFARTNYAWMLVDVLRVKFGLFNGFQPTWFAFGLAWLLLAGLAVIVSLVVTRLTAAKTSSVTVQFGAVAAFMATAVTLEVAWGQFPGLGWFCLLTLVAAGISWLRRRRGVADTVARPVSLMTGLVIIAAALLAWQAVVLH